MTRNDAADEAAGGFALAALKRPMYRLLDAIDREGGNECCVRVAYQPSRVGGRSTDAASTAGRLTRELAVGIGGYTTRGGWSSTAD